MTIASQTSRIIYNGDGTTTTFAIPFFFQANADLIVILQSAIGVQTTQILGTNYSLSGATLSAGGSCVFTTAPPAGNLVTIYRDPAATQTTSYNNNDPFPAKSHELALDKLTTLVQRIKDQISRSLRQSEGEAVMTTVLAPPLLRANRILGFDSAGNLIYPTGPAVTAVVLPTAPILPQGRLTLLSGVSVPAIDVIGSQNLYYAPFVGKYVSVNTGGFWSAYQFTSGPTDQIGLTLPLGGSASWPAGEIDDVFVVVNGGVPVLATRAWDSAMKPSAPTLLANATAITSGTTPTGWTNFNNAFNGTVHQTQANSASIASNNSQANCIGQDFGAGNPQIITQIVLTSPTDSNIRGDAPAYLPIAAFGSNDNTNWTLIDQRNIDASTINTQYTLGINTSNRVAYRYVRLCIQGTAGHANINVSQLQFYTTAPPSTRRLTQYSGILVNDAPITARINATTTIAVPQYEATFLGTVQMDAASNGQVSAHVNPGPSRVYNIWNAYNQKTITLQAVVPFTVTGVGPNNYNLSSTSYGFIQSTSTFSLSVLIGYAYEPLSVSLVRAAYMNTTVAGIGYVAGIGVDSINNISGTEFSMTTDVAGQAQGFQGVASLTLAPFFGTHSFFGVEYTAYPSAGTLSVFTNILNTSLTASWRG